MSAAWRCAASSSAGAGSTAVSPRCVRSALTRHSTAAPTTADGAAPSGSAAAGQAAGACARAVAAASAVAAATAAARTRIRMALRAGRVVARTRGSAAGPRGGVPGIPAPSVTGSRTHKTTLVLRLRVLDEPMAAGPHRGLEAVADADLAEDVAEVALDRLRADPETRGDLLVRHPGADERERLASAVAEVVARPRGAQLADARQRDARRQRRLARRGRADPRDDLVGGGVLEQVADRAVVQRLGDVLAVGERCERHDPGLAAGAHDPPRRLDAADARHLEVHEDDVRHVLGAHGDRLLAVDG